MNRTPGPLSRRDEYSAATRQALLDAALKIFSDVGFHAAALEAIAAAARVTRGALYHHFDDKTAVFDAVVELLQTQAAAAIESRAVLEKKIWNRIHVGMDAYLDECLKPSYRRLVIEEAPAVLGAQRYRQIEAENSLRLILATLNALVHRGELVCPDTNVLARVLDAIICEIAIMLPEADDEVALRTEAHRIIERVLSTYSPSTHARRLARKK